MAHTILLVQPGENPQTRTYSDFTTFQDCLEGICRIYEEHLKISHPNESVITYDVENLFDFVDNFSDLSCLVYDTYAKTYTPRTKDWVKEKLYQHLRHQVESRR